jgi:hypothetical protein
MAFPGRCRTVAVVSVPNAFAKECVRSTLVVLANREKCIGLCYGSGADERNRARLLFETPRSCSSAIILFVIDSKRMVQISIC